MPSVGTFSCDSPLLLFLLMVACFYEYLGTCHKLLRPLLLGFIVALIGACFDFVLIIYWDVLAYATVVMLFIVIISQGKRSWSRCILFTTRRTLAYVVGKFTFNMYVWGLYHVIMHQYQHYNV